MSLLRSSFLIGLRSCDDGLRAVSKMNEQRCSLSHHQPSSSVQYEINAQKTSKCLERASHISIPHPTTCDVELQSLQDAFSPNQQQCLITVFALHARSCADAYESNQTGIREQVPRMQACLLLFGLGSYLNARRICILDVAVRVEYVKYSTASHEIKSSSTRSSTSQNRCEKVDEKVK